MLPVPAQPRLGPPSPQIIQQTERVFFGFDNALSRACINATRAGRYFDGFDGTRVVGIVEADALADSRGWGLQYFKTLREAAARVRRTRPNWLIDSLSEHRDVAEVLLDESPELKNLWDLGRLRWNGYGAYHMVVSGLVIYAFDLTPR